MTEISSSITVFHICHPPPPPLPRSSSLFTSLAWNPPTSLHLPPICLLPAHPHPPCLPPSWKPDGSLWLSVQQGGLYHCRWGGGSWGDVGRSAWRGGLAHPSLPIIPQLCFCVWMLCRFPKWSMSERTEPLPSASVRLVPVREVMLFVNWRGGVTKRLNVELFLDNPCFNSYFNIN